ncbi:MAG: hypothetical protein U0931_14340 [Vulcanimicrobiota bacterium]
MWKIEDRGSERSLVNGKVLVCATSLQREVRNQDGSISGIPDRYLIEAIEPAKGKSLWSRQFEAKDVLLVAGQEGLAVWASGKAGRLE